MKDSSVFTIQHLTVTLGTTPILKDICAEVPHNAITSILGPNGSGKSTLLRTIARFHPYKGTIKLQAQDISNVPINQYRRSVAYISQTPVVFPGTIFDNICWGRKYWSLACLQETADKYLAMVGLESVDLGKQASKLSGGQKQRLHIGRSLAIEPKILLLDEPASALDAISKDSFEQLIKELIEVQKDLTIIVITHDLSQARRIADYLIVLDQGKKVLEKGSQQVFASSQGMSDVDFLNSLLANEEEEQ